MREGVKLYISSITLAELLIFQNLTQEEEEGIFDFVSLTTVVPVEEGIAIEAGRIGRKEGLRIGDSIIAATALSTNSSLLTHDKQDFKKVTTITTELI
jgi:predicted nucleic acid-binding protein